MNSRKYLLSAPTVVQLEITDSCNVRCRHCYNFWRKENHKNNRLEKTDIDRLVEMFKEAGIFHVIVTGGEPFSNFEILKYALEKIAINSISISCNSNLTLATEDKLKQLADVGLDHILTSLNSFDPSTNDYMVHLPGAFERITRGIRLARRCGLRISVNMIVSQKNKDHVYQTGKLASQLGAQRIFGTRVVPSTYLNNTNSSDMFISIADAKHTLDQLIKVKKERIETDRCR